MSTSKIISFARLCRLVSIAVAVTWLLNSLISVAPKLEEAHQTISIVLSCGFLFFVSSSAILYGIANGCKPRIKDSKAKRIVAGSSFLTEGHAFYVKAMQRESERKVILMDNGYYVNPYWTWHNLCEIGGVACFVILGLWLYAAFLYKAAELVSRRSVGAR